jgi:hypothetical protein
MDFDKRHRAAVTALVQVRCDREEMGAERREGLRKRVREMSQPASRGEAEAVKGNDSEALVVQDASAATSSCSAEGVVAEEMRDAPTPASVIDVVSCPPEPGAFTSASSPPT